MNYRNLSREKLVGFTTNAAKGVSNGEVAGFLPAQNTAIAAALNAANADLAAADQAAIEARAIALQATQFAQDAEASVVKLLSDLKFSMRGVDAPVAAYDVIGFNPPSEARRVILPATPTELAATGFSNGVNLLTFRGNNVSGSVTYVVQALIGDTADYVVVGTCRAQKFRHDGVTPGQFYQYRVRAQSGRGIVSEWSNTAVVYGHI